MEPQMFMMLGFLLVMMIPMFLMSRSQKKRMEKQKEILKKIGVGDEVRTHSGFYGMIVEEIGDDLVVLETEDGSQLKWARQAIAESVQSFGGAPNDAHGATGSESVAGVTVDSESDNRGDRSSDRDFS